MSISLALPMPQQHFSVVEEVDEVSFVLELYFAYQVNNRTVEVSYRSEEVNERTILSFVICEHPY